MKHVSKFCHVNPTISSKVMVIGVLLAYLRTADNGRKPPTKTAKTYGNVWVRHRLRHHSGGRQGPYLPSADSSEHDLKRGELRFMLPKVIRTSGATRMHSCERERLTFCDSCILPFSANPRRILQLTALLRYSCS